MLKMGLKFIVVPLLAVAACTDVALDDDEQGSLSEAAEQIASDGPATMGDPTTPPTSPPAQPAPPGGGGGGGGGGCLRPCAQKAPPPAIAVPRQGR